MILVQAEIVAIEAEIDIEPAVMVVVGDSRVRERALRRARELEGIALEGKFSRTVVEEKKRPAAANDKQILHAFVFEIGE